KDAESRLLDRCIQGCRNCEAEHAPCIDRIDDAVVPEARRRVVRMALALVLLADRRLERVFLFLRPGLAGCLDAVAAHGREHTRGLLAAHHADARVRPHPEEARLVAASAHRVVAGAEAAA